MKLTKAQQLVYNVIQLNQGVQNDDADLIAAVWRRQGWSDSRGLEQNIAVVMRPESITRRRRELYNMNLITYSPEALKSRTEAFKKEVNKHSTYERTKAQIVNPTFKEVDGETVVVI